MNFRFAQRLTAQAGRSSTRAARVPLANSSRVARRYASTSHGSNGGSDLPWMIGSAAFFGSAAVYLLLPSSDKAVHHAAQGHGNLTPGSEIPKDDEHSATPEKSEPVILTDDEGTEMPEAAVKDSLKIGYASNSPMDGEAVPIGKDATATLSDDEGNTISHAEAEKSKEHSDVDSPKDAQSAEEKGTRFDNGAPGMDETAETDHEQKEKPGKKSEDSSDDSGTEKKTGQALLDVPKDLGAARKQTSQGTSSGQSEGKEH